MCCGGCLDGWECLCCLLEYVCDFVELEFVFGVEGYFFFYV